MFDQFTKTFGYGSKYPNTAYFRSVGLAGKSHIGIDRLMPVGTPIPAPGNGRIEHRETAALGKAVYHYDEIGTLTRFAHNSQFVAPEGNVIEGQIMALSGNEGISTAPHCHYDCWLGGRYTGKFEDTIDPEKYWDNPIKIKVLYTIKGDIKRLDFVRKWYRPYVNIKFDYVLVPERELKKTLHGKYFSEYDVQMNYLPYADNYDICLLMTPQLDDSTGLLGYFTRDTMFGMYFATSRLDYDMIRKQNDPDLPRGMIEGVVAHELSHAFDYLMGRKFAGNEVYDSYKQGYDNTHYFDYVANTLHKNIESFDTRRMKRSMQKDYMFKYNRGGTTKLKPNEKINTVYRDWNNTFFCAYTKNGWEKIAENNYKESKAKGSASMILDDREVRWIIANTSIKYTFPILGIRATRKGTKARQIMLKTLGWQEHIPFNHLI